MRTPAANTGTLRIITALVCLIALFFTTASCLFHTEHQQSTCSHCSGHAPQQQPQASCCTPHSQPASIEASPHSEDLALLALVIIPSLSAPALASDHPIAPQSTPPPLRRSLQVLRI